MVYLIDTNVIVRFLVQEESGHYRQSIEYMEQIESGKIEVELLGEVVMEVLFIMTKYYGAPLLEITEDIKTILRLDGVANKDKYVLIEALNVMVKNKIDFVDALICAKSTMQGYGKISFDKDVMKKCE